MIGTRIGGEEIWLEEREWEIWVEDGRIPADAFVLTDGGWVPAGRLPVYRTIRSSVPRPEPGPPNIPVVSIVFPKRGFSATEVVLLINLLAGAALLAFWGDDYTMRLRETATAWWQAVHYRHEYWWWLPPSILHVDTGHIAANMVSLLVGAGAVEVLMGSRWVSVVYVGTALGCSALSYWGHDGPPLSVGASGVVFGMAGAVVAFVARRYRMFTYRQRWKARRIYAALLVLFVLPSILGHDYWGHVGGFLAGLLLGAVIPPHPRWHEAIAAAEGNSGGDAHQP
jgi:membrane associated rhomboid family serine protease